MINTEAHIKQRVTERRRQKTIRRGEYETGGEVEREREQEERGDGRGFDQYRVHALVQ